MIKFITGNGHVGMAQILFIFVLIAITNIVDTSAYAARLAGVRTQRLAISNTLYSMLTIGSRTTTALYLPAIGGITDSASKFMFNPQGILQFVLLGSTIGTAIGIFLMPSMVNFYSLGIQRMDDKGSVYRVLSYLITNKEGVRELVHCYQSPTVKMLKNTKVATRDLYILNSILYGFFTVGSIAALYAGVLSPDHTASANQLSTAINALAAFLLLFLVDPKSAMIMDHGLAKKIPLDTVRHTMVTLALGRLTGTVLSQFVLYPGAHFVSFLARFF